MFRATSPAAAARLAKIMALLDSDQAGEATAAARALRRVLTPDAGRVQEAAPAVPADGSDELEACLAYAVDAVAQLTREIEGLRRDNARLRGAFARQSAAAARGASHRPAPWARVAG